MDAARKSRLVRAVQKQTVNRLFRSLVAVGLAPGYAVLETTGRKSGQPRRVPVGNGLRDGVFWVVAEQGRRADWVRNIEANPTVRVRVRRRWQSGVAHVLVDDNPTSRFGREIPRWNAAFIKAIGTDLLTVRIDLGDISLPPAGSGHGPAS